MKAVILEGGFGTRISEESKFKNKKMIEIGGMPIIRHIMKLYSFYGINEFIICAGIDGKTNELKWVNGFTWMEDETMLLRCRDEMTQKSKFLIKDYSQWIQKNIKLWKRKEFKDFEYIEDDAALSDGQMMGILITVIIVNLIMTFIIGCALLDNR